MLSSALKLLLALEQPVIGFSFTVNVTVRYLIKDKTAQKTIFDEVFKSSYIASLSESIVGIQRLRLANEGAIRNNIELFLKKVVNS